MKESEVGSRESEVQILFITQFHIERLKKAEVGSRVLYDCNGCPIKQQCIGKSHEKRINITAYRKEYERNIAQVNSPQGRYMKAKR